ncbi:MAG: glycosyl transferase [Chloroflexi bacterium RBG_13_54_9]|nr:MAG: glycosyl transferase [Chloroflexi bacterium RBG_13_54_9]
MSDSSQPGAAGTTYRVSIIIPNWNGIHLLPTCLDALRRQTYRDFEVLIVDNASEDGSVELLEKEYPEVKVVRLDSNRFFSGAVNEGIRRSRGEIVVLLNNDTEVEPQWLAELVKALDEAPEAGMAASKMLLFDRRIVLNSAGDYYRRDGVPGNRGVWERDGGQYDAATAVFGACGGAAAYRRRMLDDIGLLDEDFVGYCEDVDLNFRAQLAGYRCVFAPKARVYHRLSATGGGPVASYLCGRNFINVVVKDMPTRLIKKYWPRMVAAQLGYVKQSLWHFREPAARARLRGQFAAIFALPAMLAKRKMVQASRKVSDEYIDSILED